MFCTCREDNVLGDELVVDDGELRELYPVDPGHGAVSAPPVELDVIGGVSVCSGEGQNTQTNMILIQ